MFGDFNLNWLNKNNLYTQEFSTLLTTFNLEQIVTEPTHIGGGLIDFVIIDKNLLSSNLQVETCTNFQSDHYPVRLTYMAPIKTFARYETKNVRSYENCDLNLITRDIKNSDLNNPALFSQLSAEQCVELYNSTLTHIFDLHCPIVTKRYRTDCVRPPWYNCTLQKTKQKTCGEEVKKTSKCRKQSRFS